MALAARAPVDDTVTADVRGRWDALPQLSGAWEKRMIARRDQIVPERSQTCTLPSLLPGAAYGNPIAIRFPSTSSDAPYQ